MLINLLYFVAFAGWLYLAYLAVRLVGLMIIDFKYNHQRRQKQRREAFHDRQRELHSMLNVEPMLQKQAELQSEKQHEVPRWEWDGYRFQVSRHHKGYAPPQVQLNKLRNPPPPPVFGECSGCHLDSIYDLRQPYSKLCGSCVDLAEAKKYNMETWGAST